MTTADELNALAARVMALEGPCREPDATIYHDVLGYCRHSKKTRSGYQDDTGFDCDDCGADSWGNTSKAPWPVGQRLHFSLPAFTASLDAAMSLVPDGWCFEVTLWQDKQASASVSQYNPGEQDYEAIAATPALALTAAALLARAALEKRT